MANLSRRNFLTAFTSSVFGFGLAKNVKASSKNTGSAQGGASPIKVQKYNDMAPQLTSGTFIPVFPKTR